MKKIATACKFLLCPSSYMRNGAVRASGNSSTTLSYSFTDAAPRKSANFYRIRQVDYDGRFTYTPVRLLNFDEATSGSLLVYPVPARTKLIVSLPAQLDGLTTVTIHSTDGRLVQQQQVPVQGGLLMDFDISALPRGIYHLKTANVHKQGIHNICEAVVFVPKRSAVEAAMLFIGCVFLPYRTPIIYC